MSRRGLALAAMLAVGCVYLRPEAVLFVAMWVGLGLWRGGVSASWLQGGVILLAVVVALLPWAARNRAKLGHWVWLTTNGGASLYDGVGPTATGGSDLAEGLGRPEIVGLSELERDAFFQDQAWAAMRRDPGRIVQMAWVKVLRTWNWRPNFAPYRGGWLALTSVGWMSAVSAMACVGLCRVGWRRRWALAVMLLPAVYWTALHGVFVGSVRYRQAAMPMVEVLAAVGLAAVLGWLKVWRSDGLVGEGRGGRT